jgi:hypothetical protein
VWLCLLQPITITVEGTPQEVCIRLPQLHTSAFEAFKDMYTPTVIPPCTIPACTHSVLPNHTTMYTSCACAPQERSCTKVYVARVLGRFPGSEAEVQALIEARPAGQAHGVRWVNSQQAAGSKDSGPDMAAAPAGPTPQEQREAQQQTGAKVEGAGANQGSGGSSSDDGAQVVEVDVSLTWDASTNHAAAVPKGEGGGWRGFNR